MLVVPEYQWKERGVAATPLSARLSTHDPTICVRHPLANEMYNLPVPSDMQSSVALTHSIGATYLAAILGATSATSALASHMYPNAPRLNTT